MFDQFIDSFRRASESSLLGQQQLFKQWLQQYTPAPPLAQNAPADWVNSLYRRWSDALGETLGRQRELLDSSCRTGLQIFEQGLRVSEIRSADDYRRLVDETWRKLSDTFKDQAEAHLREFQRASEKWFNAVPKAQA